MSSTKSLSASKAAVQQVFKTINDNKEWIKNSSTSAALNRIFANLSLSAQRKLFSDQQTMVPDLIDLLSKERTGPISASSATAVTTQK